MIASSSRLSSPNTLPAIVLYSQTVDLPIDVAAAKEIMMTAPNNDPRIKLLPSILYFMTAPFVGYVSADA